jgi:hypothetical protein
MVRKRRVFKSKTAIRSFMRRLAQIEIDTLDRFRDHVRDAAASRRRSINKRADDLPPEVQELLADDLQELDVISDLADQLAIVGLYRVVEISTGRIVAHKFGVVARRKASSIGALHAFLTQHGINIGTIPHYRAINELRLLNNAIKHAGHVTAELANEYPRWKEGQDLTGLGIAYNRLKGRVPSYIFRFAERLKMRYR